MNKNNNLLYLMVAILAAAMGYFYIDKTNPEFFQNLLNKFTNSEESGWKEEVIPQEKEIPKEETKPAPTEPDDLKITPPTDDELLPPDDEDDDQPRRPRRRT